MQTVFARAPLELGTWRCAAGPYIATRAGALSLRSRYGNTEDFVRHFGGRTPLQRAHFRA